MTEQYYDPKLYVGMYQCGTCNVHYVGKTTPLPKVCRVPECGGTSFTYMTEVEQVQQFIKADWPGEWA